MRLDECGKLEGRRLSDFGGEIARKSEFMNVSERDRFLDLQEGPEK
jgi:hypothetical protein